MSIAFDNRPSRPSRTEIEPVALDLIRRRGAEVLSTARRYACSPEDAEDAYQRALEILLTKAPTTSPDDLLPWLKTVVKHEAYALRKKRERDVPAEQDALDAFAGDGSDAADERAERYDRLRVGAEALGRLKPQETQCLLLKAEGLSYEEIAAHTGFTYTKVNRCLTEGRRAFVARVAGIESGAECERLAPLLSALADGEASAEDLAAVRPHLRGCSSCRATLRDYRAAPAKVAALAPPAGILGSLLGSGRDLVEGAAGWISERSASLALRWHQAAELAAAHKVAAVAASTALLAGGGAASVATVDRLDRPAVVRPTAGSSAVPSPPPVRGSNESAALRNATASSGRAKGQAAPRREPARADRDSAPTARPAEESSAPAPAGEFTPDPAPAGPPSTKPDRPVQAAESEPVSGGEFAP